jgi:hypothetical protein
MDTTETNPALGIAASCADCKVLEKTGAPVPGRMAMAGQYAQPTPHEAHLRGGPVKRETGGMYAAPTGVKPGTYVNP